MEFHELISEIQREMNEEKPEEFHNHETAFKIMTKNKKDSAIMYPYALDVFDEEVVYIRNANPKKRYVCLDCKQVLIPRALESEKIHAHFYHKSGEERRCEESYEHYFVKNKLFNNLRNKIGDEIFLDFWYLIDENQARVNLMKDVVDIKLEHNTKDNGGNARARADIALLNENDEVLWAVEIVHSHRVEKETLEFYKNSEINCIEVYISDWKKYEILHYIQEPAPHFDGQIFESVELRNNVTYLDYKARLVIRNRYSRPPESKMLNSLTTLFEFKQSLCHEADDKYRFYLTGDDLLELFVFLRDNQELVNLLIAQRRDEERNQFYEKKQFKEIEKVWRTKHRNHNQLSLDDSIKEE